MIAGLLCFSKSGTEPFLLAAYSRGVLLYRVVVIRRNIFVGLFLCTAMLLRYTLLQSIGYT